MKKKILLCSLAVVMLAAGCNKQASQPISKSAGQQDTKITSAESQTSGKLADKPVSQSASQPVSDPVSQQDNQPTPQPLRQQLQVVQKVAGQFGDKLFNFYADENKTALDLLNMSYKVEVKHYSGIGDMVISIAGQKAGDKHFWEFFINDKSSNVGAGSYKPVNGDKLEWKFSEIK